MRPFAVELTFHGDLPFFLKSKTSKIERQLSERTSVKDVIEACGIPHTEVDMILIDGNRADFGAILTQDVVIDVYPPNEQCSTLLPEDRLQVTRIERFVADGHLGKLVRDLRLLGIDVACDPVAEDRQLVEIASTENRALLTRDRRLLMHGAVRHGYYLRSQEPLEQTVEVLQRFSLSKMLDPFSRCLRCNALLQAAEKSEIVEQLEPLTKVYYEKFRRCPDCGQVYWSGSHFAKLEKRVEVIRSRLKHEG